MACVYYDRILNKKVPCLIDPNTVYSLGETKYVKVLFDSSRFVDYNVTKHELNRYSNDMVKLINIYPVRTAEEIAYMEACIPNNVTDDHVEKDLARLLEVITILTEVVGSIKKDTFFQLADFISYELLFSYCTYEDRLFLLTICSYNLPGVPAIVRVPKILLMIKRIFSKYNDTTITYQIQNYKNLAEFSYITFPLEINIVNLKYNIELLVP